MTQEKLKNLISQGENEFVEFKLNFDNSAIETLVAFANHKGGKIFIGVSDKGQILGTKLGKESIQKMINEIKQNNLKYFCWVVLLLVKQAQICE